ncbi:cold-shock protein [Chloroflexota bacterium]
MPQGTIKTLIDRGFGFIKAEDGTDVFFHRNDLEGVEFSSLIAGQEVEYEKSQGREGRSAAVKVRLTETKVSDDGGDDQGGGEDEVKA